MMKSFIYKLDEYDCVVFDLDGTLYDEFDFIYQAYYEVSRYLAEILKIDVNCLHCKMCNLWLENGSSAPIFQLAIEECSRVNVDIGLIKTCVELYRNAEFSLTIPSRTKYILDYLKKKHKKMIIVTDGNSSLQRRKIDRLGLNEWFDMKDIFVSGDFGKGCQKPNNYMATKFQHNSKKIVYLGDRDIDEAFAKNANIDFIPIKVMNIV